MSREYRQKFSGGYLRRGGGPMEDLPHSKLPAGAFKARLEQLTLPIKQLCSIYSTPFVLHSSTCHRLLLPHRYLLSRW
jgi:hypothetical protein